MADEPMHLDQVLRASYTDALTLGVHGVSADALARRVDAARAVLTEHTARSNAAYTAAPAARETEEPYVPEPFGADLVVKHGGDLDQVLADPDFTDAVQRGMELHTHEVYISDEDGPRYEMFQPTTEDLVAVREQTDLIRPELADAGDVAGGAVQDDAPQQADAQQTVGSAIRQEAPETEWVTRARLGGELAADTLTTFLDERGLTGTNWDPREDQTAPATSMDSATRQALEDHERRAGHFQTIASMTRRYEQALADGAADAAEWRADIIGAVDDYGLTGTRVDPRGVLPEGQLTPTARADQAALVPAAQARVTRLEREAAGVEQTIAMFGPDDDAQAQLSRLGSELSALGMFTRAPATAGVIEPSATAGTPARAEVQQADPVRIAADLQHGSRSGLWDESEWPDPESGEQLRPFVELGLGRPVAETVQSRRFVDDLAFEVAASRTVGEDLPEVTAADQAEALRLAPQVWDALAERGEQLPAQPEWWRAGREQLRADSPALQARMEQAYLDGYDARIRSGLAYAAAVDDGARASLGGAVTVEKAASYEALERARRTIDGEVSPLAVYSDDAADLPLTPAAEAALVDAAREAGRWGGLDAGADDLLERIDGRLAEQSAAPSVYAGDGRDAWFNYLDPDVQTARQALPQIERDNTVRAARTAAQTQPGAEAKQGRPALFERLRKRRDERRAQTAAAADPGRQAAGPQQGAQMGGAR